MPVTEENFHEIKRSFVNRGWRDTLSRYSLSIPQAKVIQDSVTYQGFVASWKARKYKNELNKIKNTAKEHNDVGNRIHFPGFDKANVHRVEKVEPQHEHRPQRQRMTINRIVPPNGTAWFTHDQLVSVAKNMRAGYTLTECSYRMGFKSATGLYMRLARDPQALEIVKKYSGRDLNIKQVERTTKRRPNKSVRVIKSRTVKSKAQTEPAVEVEVKVKDLDVKEDDNYAGCIKFYKRRKLNYISVALAISSVFMSAILAVMKALGMIDIAWVNCLMPVAIFAIIELICVFITGFVTVALFGNFPDTEVKVEKRPSGKR